MRTPSEFTKNLNADEAARTKNQYMQKTAEKLFRELSIT